jgi:hypothetical protein
MGRPTFGNQPEGEVMRRFFSLFYRIQDAQPRRSVCGSHSVFHVPFQGKLLGVRIFFSLREGW